MKPDSNMNTLVDYFVKAIKHGREALYLNCFDIPEDEHFSITYKGEDYFTIENYKPNQLGLCEKGQYVIHGDGLVKLGTTILALGLAYKQARGDS